MKSGRPGPTRARPARVRGRNAYRGPVSVPEFRSARTLDLDVVVLYRLLRLRSDVFVVEEQRPYPDLDGRDLEPGARQMWFERDGDILATLRLLRDPDGTARIGRPCTTPSARDTDVPAQLVERALQMAANRDCVVDAREDDVAWYERFGFARVEDTRLIHGVPHVPMRRPGGASGAP